MTTPTPRTDALDAELGVSDLRIGDAGRYRKLASQLERELAAAQEARQRAEAVLKQFFLNDSPWPDVESREQMQSFVDEMTTEEVGRWGKAHPHHFCAALLVRAQRAEALAESNARDAQRYRWLREGTGLAEPTVFSCTERGYAAQPLILDELDAAIDAAIAEGKK